MAPVPRVTMSFIVATVLTVIAGGLYYVYFLTAGAGTDAVSYAFVPVGGVFACLAVVDLLRRGPLAAGARRFWRTVLVAFVLLTSGYGWLAADMLAHFAKAGERNMPLGAAALAGLGFVVVMWAVALAPAGDDERERWRPLLDRTIAFLGVATLLWHFGLAPMTRAEEPWSDQAMVLIGLAYLMAVAAITKVSYLGGDGPVDRGALRLLAGVGLTAAAVAMLAVRFGLEGGVPSQSLVMPLAPVLAAFAVRSQWRTGDAPAQPAGRAGRLVPYLAVVAITTPLLAVAAGPIRWTDRSVILAAVAIGVLIALRQFITFRENSLLLVEKRGSEERLRHEVTHDGLTGLANRALFREELTAALLEGRVTVLLIDLDDFKTVNDSLGHDVGDRLLVSVAEVLRAGCDDDGLPVRLAGDEFAVLMRGGGTSGEEVSRRLLDLLGRPIGTDRLLVQASIGIAPAERGTAIDTVLRRADVAMYTAKQRGKAGFVRYLPGMEAPVLAHMQLGGELRRALDEGEFQVHYQPVMSLEDRRVVGIEALVRWQHPTRGMVSPAEFIPAAERTGLIVPIGLWVLRETCRQTSAWIAEFGPDALQKAGVNVSARQLHDPDFVTDVQQALCDSGLTSDRIVLELTESAVLRGQQVSRALHDLDALGVKLALDDFGTGESSLSLLRSFPAAIVKLDKSFVDGIEIEDGDPEASDARQAVARAVRQLSAALRLDTVAEGIENEAQVERLRELGYTLGQGFHLARPMPAEAMTRLLAGQRSVVPAN